MNRQKYVRACLLFCSSVQVQICKQKFIVRRTVSRTRRQAHALLADVSRACAVIWTTTRAAVEQSRDKSGRKGTGTVRLLQITQTSRVGRGRPIRQQRRPPARHCRSPHTSYAARPCASPPPDNRNKMRRPRLSEAARTKRMTGGASSSCVSQARGGAPANSAAASETPGAHSAPPSRPELLRKDVLCVKCATENCDCMCWEKRPIRLLPCCYLINAPTAIPC